MSKVHITRHSIATQRWARLSSGTLFAALGAQDGDSLTLDCTAAVQSSAALTEGLYEISVDGANVRLRIGENAVANATGQFWFDGRTDLRYVRAGERISVIRAV